MGLRFEMLIGPSASGKTSYALKYNRSKFFFFGGVDIDFRMDKADAAECYIVMSSDYLRGQLWGDEENQRHPEIVFELMEYWTCKYLRYGYNVIYDATNLSAERRTKLLERIKLMCSDIEVEFIASYFNVKREVLIERDATRARHVGENVINKQLAQYKFPTFEEGWNVIQEVRVMK